MDAVEIVSVIVTVPVLVGSYYLLILFIGSLFYNRQFRKLERKTPDAWPSVTVLVAVYNEKFVIERALDSLKSLDYPKKLLQVIIADDSTDETRDIIDRKSRELQSQGVEVHVSRRSSRDGFKVGALNTVAPLIRGDYVLLLDADSIVSSDALIQAIPLFINPDVAFVAYRIGTYNRDQYLVTKLYALTFDLCETQQKMGGTALNLPFSYSGGSTVVHRRAIEDVRYWSDATLTEDTDLSARIYCSGRRGVYLSSVRIYAEAPVSMAFWKRQSARVVQGWAEILRRSWREIIGARELSILRRLSLVMFLLTPLSGLAWIVVSFINAAALILGLTTSEHSLFSNPWYNLLVSTSVAGYFAAAFYALHVQKMASLKNVLLIPFLIYAGSGIVAASSVGFLRGIAGRTVSFFRTPKAGTTTKTSGKNDYLWLELDRVEITELVLSLAALVLAILVVQKGVWFLALSLVGFGLLTLKSMNLSRLFVRPNTTLES